MKVENLWPDFGDFGEYNTPKEILEQQAKFLPKLTGEIIYADVRDLTDSELLFESEIEDVDFAYKFLLKSKFMDKYQFEILTVFHEITVYPIKVRIENLIKKEVLPDKPQRTITLNSEEEFTKLLSDIFRTSRIKGVIGSLLKLSK